MGLLDKFKDTAKSVAGAATEKLSAMKEENEKRSAEKEADLAVIQKLSACGSVTSFLDRPTTPGYYELCVDKENRRFVMRKESDKKPFKIFEFSEFSALKFVGTEVAETEKNITNRHNLHLEFGAFPLDLTVRCMSYKDPANAIDGFAELQKRKVCDILNVAVYIIKDEATKNWANEMCGYFELLPLYDENGSVIAENLNQ